MKKDLNLKLIAVITLLLTAFNATAQQFDWAKSARGGYESVGNGIATDAHDNVITTGFYSGNVDFNPGTDSLMFNSVSLTNDIYLQKLDSGGALQWAKSIGGDDIDAGNAVVTDATGNIYVAGYFSSSAEFNPGGTSVITTSAGNTDIFVAKYSALGDLNWVNTYGGSSIDGANAIAIDRAGNIYVTGYFSGSSDFDQSAGTTTLTAAGSKDIFVLKLNNGGDFIWAKGVGSSDDDMANALALDTAQNVIIAGGYQGTVNFDPNGGTTNLVANGYMDAFAAKFSATGSVIWAKSMGSTDFDDAVRGVAVDVANNTILTGYYRGIADFDPGVAVVNTPSAAYNNIFTLKLNAAGNFVWVKSVDGSSWEESYAITTDNQGNIYTTGYFESDVDFDPNAGDVTLSPTAYSDVYIQKLSPTGDLTWVKNVAGTGSDGGNGIALDTRGNVYCTGYFSNTADFDPQSTVFNLPVVASQQSAFQFKWFQTIPTAINEPTALANLIAFPNPTQGNLTIQLDKPYNQLNALVVDQLGQQVSDENFNSTQLATINMQNLAAGVYFIHLQTGNNSSVIRVVKN